MFEAARRVTAGKINKKKVLCLDKHLLTITLIASFGFMKFSEVSSPRRSDLIFSSTYVKAFIEKIKTNILGKECGFTSQFLVKFLHWNNLNISWPSQKHSKNLRNSFSGALVEARNPVCTHTQKKKIINKPIS